MMFQMESALEKLPKFMPISTLHRYKKKMRPGEVKKLSMVTTQVSKTYFYALPSNVWSS